MSSCRRSCRASCARAGGDRGGGCSRPRRGGGGAASVIAAIAAQLIRINSTKFLTLIASAPDFALTVIKANEEHFQFLVKCELDYLDKGSSFTLHLNPIRSDHGAVGGCARLDSFGSAMHEGARGIEHVAGCGGFHDHRDWDLRELDGALGHIAPDVASEIALRPRLAGASRRREGDGRPDAIRGQPRSVVGAGSASGKASFREMRRGLSPDWGWPAISTAAA
jgi:hypothetical protein